eukprot:sb/3464255/
MRSPCFGNEVTPCQRARSSALNGVTTGSSALNGVTTGSSALNGVTTGSSALNGVTTGSSALNGVTTGSSALNGVTTGSSALNGVTTGSSALNGVTTGSSALNGVTTGSSALNGVTTGSSALNGVTTGSSALNGVTTGSSALNGVTTGSSALNGVTTGSSALNGVTTGSSALNGVTTGSSALNGVTTGSSALNGVTTVGSTNEEDVVISKIGPCVDLFAPGYSIPAAGTEDSVDRVECTGSLCAAALAAGVIAQTLRSNSKITVEVQKSMLINGATQRKDLSLNFKEGSDYEDLNLVEHTQWRLLYYACGYYKDPGTPECISHSSWCDNVAISTFDGNSVPIYQQATDRCKFVVFEAESGEKVIGSYEDCSLATYTITIPNGGGVIELKPGPYINFDGVEILTPKMLAEGDDGFSMEGDGYKIVYQDDLSLPAAQPSVEVQFGTSIRMVYDCTSKLTIQLLDSATYKGKTGGLCGLYDNVGE